MQKNQQINLNSHNRRIEIENELNKISSDNLQLEALQQKDLESLTDEEKERLSVLQAHAEERQNLQQQLENESQELQQHEETLQSETEALQNQTQELERQLELSQQIADNQSGHLQNNLGDTAENIQQQAQQDAALTEGANSEDRALQGATRLAGLKKVGAAIGGQIADSTVSALEIGITTLFNFEQ